MNVAISQHVIQLCPHKILDLSESNLLRVIVQICTCTGGLVEKNMYQLICKHELSPENTKK